jgi:pyruvate kinase
VRKPSDIIELREILKKRKSDAGIIAKIETPKALENIDEIIELSDGIMIARGDLAIEIPFEKVPSVQKMIIEKCIMAGKPVITATQMLESMIKSPIATRAEVSDVANAILDGTDAVMLSEETTLGEYPVEAVSVMARIAEEVEKNYPERKIADRQEMGNTKVPDSITSSVVKTAHDVGAKVIVALTESGFTARMVSRHRPQPVILAMSSNVRTCQKLTLSFGCVPVTLTGFQTLTDIFKIIKTYCLKEKLLQKGDTVVIVAGAPQSSKSIKTNMLIVETI